MTDPAALARFNSYVLRARAAYDTDRAKAERLADRRRAERRAYDRARYRAKKETR